MTEQSTDPVLHWNAEFIAAVRAEGGPPTTVSRAAAIVHVAMYDAAVAVARTANPYALRFPPYVDGIEPSLEAAINQAGYQALRTVYPGRDFTVALDDATSRLGLRVRPIPLIRGAAIGSAAAEAVVRARIGDGSESSAPYVAVLEAGAWRPTGSGAAVSPHWGLVRPWSLSSGDQYRPQPPDDAGSYEKLLDSDFYEQQVEEVRLLGARDSSQRTAEETEQAHFWSEDRHLGHTRTVAVRQGLSTLENARLFALVAMATADATIAVWDAKYLSGIDLWRPETAVRFGPDRGWSPLSDSAPAYPAYVSAHAVLAGAWATTMRLFLGTDEVADFGSFASFTSFARAAEEAARSRVLLGVNYPVAADNGLDLGRNVAQHVHANHLR